MRILKVFCSYNEEYHNFLNKVVDSILDKYGSQLNISALEEIELVDKRKYKYITDGKTYYGRIEVTSRLYELLPTLEIEDLENNNDYKLLRKTLYHEMGHINDMTLMPQLYNCILESFESRKINSDSIVSLFWVEYVAEKRTAFFENIYNLDICDDFVKRKWHCSIADPYTHYSEKNFFYLTKLLPYFMARTNKKDLREQYLNRIENKLLIQYINEMDNEVRFLETKGIFDDVYFLKRLYTIIDKYCKAFMNKYVK